MNTSVSKNPFPVRLGELKEPLQQQAFEEDRSLHYWIKKILRDHLKQPKKATNVNKHPK